MSPITWTPTALASEASPWTGLAWRLVEAQHAASTTKLVDGAREQVLLEQMLEAAKPRPAASAQRLHYLLAMPFRYPPLPRGSRFRAPGEPGVFYGAGHLHTACAELGYWRWRFLLDCPELQRIGPVAQTAFRVRLRGRGLDLRQPPLVRDRASWTAPDDYAATQELARAARAADINVIVYESVRDPEHRACMAALSPAAFAEPVPYGETQTWWLTVQTGRAIWIRDRENFQFDFSADGTPLPRPNPTPA